MTPKEMQLLLDKIAKLEREVEELTKIVKDLKWEQLKQKYTLS